MSENFGAEPSQALPSPAETSGAGRAEPNSHHTSKFVKIFRITGSMCCVCWSKDQITHLWQRWMHGKVVRQWASHWQRTPDSTNRTPPLNRNNYKCSFVKFRCPCTLGYDGIQQVMETLLFVYGVYSSLGQLQHIDVCLNQKNHRICHGFVLPDVFNNNLDAKGLHGPIEIEALRSVKLLWKITLSQLCLSMLCLLVSRLPMYLPSPTRFAQYVWCVIPFMWIRILSFVMPVSRLPAHQVLSMFTARYWAQFKFHAFRIVVGWTWSLEHLVNTN